MSNRGSLFSKGGGGTHFEQCVQTAFLTTMIVKGSVPGLPDSEISEIAFQVSRLGYKTDDILCKSKINEHRLLVQVKHELSFTPQNKIFNEVIEQFWADFNNTDRFNRQTDRLWIIKEVLNKDEANHVKSILNWAKSHSTSDDFLLEVRRMKGKEETLNIFKEVAEKKAGKKISESELFEFLKCIDLLAYDFGNSASKDEASFINLINLSKSKESVSSGKEIWDSIFSFVAQKNKDGGSFTYESIQKEQIYKYFDIQKLNPYFNSVKKLRNASESILKPLDSKIKGFHIERADINQSIVSSVNNFHFTVVTGKPGVGKSAAVKDILYNDFSSASVFVFRADQFNRPHLANVFSEIGVHETIQDIISYISLIPEKIFVIDSLEKLLEGDPENAFKQLLSFLNEFKDIKVILISRQYAIALIMQKFKISKESLNIVEVPLFNKQELDMVASKFPQLTNILKNNKIEKILQIPKYLEYAISSLDKYIEDYSELSLTEFKDKLWNNIVEDITTKKGGLSQKRRKAFLNIAVKRAKKMTLFVDPDSDIDSEAIEALEKDGVIFQDKDRFSPSHDILEDWAIVKYVAAKYEEYPNPKELFANLGNEPAIRRAFRLWIEDYLIDDSDKIIELIELTLKDDTIEKYWSDELLIAVFKSDDCKYFFENLEDDLLQQEAALLVRSLHCIRIACKESISSKFLFPIGSGWNEAIKFINHHKNELDSCRLIICNLLFDWQLKLYKNDYNELPEETKEVKDITLHYTAFLNELW